MARQATAVAVREQTRKENLVKLSKFMGTKEGLLAGVLPPGMDPKRMIKLALGCASRTPKLQDCTVQSITLAVSLSCSLGLEPGSPLGHAYLVPFWNKQKRCMEAQFIPGYKGLIDLARRSGEIETIEARLVYEKDVFEFEYGLEPKLVHRPHLGKERGKIIAVYGLARIKGGQVQCEVMALDEIEAIRDAVLSRNFKDEDERFGPWIDHFGEMARKTVIRRLCKYLPVGVQLASAVELDRQAEMGERQNLSTGDSIDVLFEDLDPDTPQEEDTQERINTAKQAAKAAREARTSKVQPIKAEEPPQGPPSEAMALVDAIGEMLDSLAFQKALRPSQADAFARRIQKAGNEGDLKALDGIRLELEKIGTEEPKE